MTGRTGIGIHGGGMTGTTASPAVEYSTAVFIHTWFRMRESKLGWAPGVGGVAGSAVQPKSSSVKGWFSMTGRTGTGHAGEIFPPMTACAAHPSVRAGQGEAGEVMIKGGWPPGSGGVALNAVIAKATAMGIVFLVTGDAFGWSTLEGKRLVTAPTGNADMCPSKREVGEVVIEIDPLPALGGVTVLALGQLSLMRILLTMAGKTIHRRALIAPILMTAFAGYLLMFACKFEASQIMVKFSGFPAIGGMTGGTITTKASLMWVIFLVTGNAFLWRCL